MPLLDDRQPAEPQPGSTGAVWTIVVAGGAGHRYGSPKQHVNLGGLRILDRSLAVAHVVSNGVVLVVTADRVEHEAGRADRVVAGGSTRSESVRCGLAAGPPEADIIVVHDAARPLAPVAVFHRAIDAVRSGSAAVITALPMVDTLKRVNGATVAETVDRSSLISVQTPQAFRAQVLRDAHASGSEATDDAGLVEALGFAVSVVAGDVRSQKLTTPDDLTILESFLAKTVGDNIVAIPELRIGHGFDVHPFSEDPARTLVLGGITFAGTAGLAGHSDADAVAHAITDALLGAAGLGDIGHHFPDTDPTWRGANSMNLLAATVALVRNEGWSIANVDTSVVLEAPKLAPHRDAMVKALTGTVGAPVSVKAKRAEGLGALGRREGIACFAVALLVRER